MKDGIGQDLYRYQTIPKRQVEIIRKQLKRGVPYHALSPTYPITREIAALILKDNNGH